MTDRAVFIDRDGVINHDWFNPATGAWESPIRAADLVLCDFVPQALSALRAHGFRLVLVSNQPSAAKGKCSLLDLAAVHHALVARLGIEGIGFDESCYSYTHPQAVVPALGPPCRDRKPEPFFLERAIHRWRLDRARCWMVGDRETDIECGRRAGLRTIQVENPRGAAPQGAADATVPHLMAATAHILAH